MGYLTKRFLERGLYIVFQNRFLSRSSENSTSDGIIYRWWIPLTYTSAAHETGERIAEWMSDNDQAKTLTLHSQTTKRDWVIFNVDQQSNCFKVTKERLLIAGYIFHQIITV